MAGCLCRVFIQHGEMPGHQAGHLLLAMDLDLGVAALRLPFGSARICVGLPFSLPLSRIVRAVDPTSLHRGASFGPSLSGFGLALGPVCPRLGLPIRRRLLAVTRALNSRGFHLGLPLSSTGVGFSLTFGPTRLHPGLPLGTRLVELSRRRTHHDRTGRLSVRGTRHNRRHRQRAQNKGTRRNERCHYTFHCELLT